MFFKMYSISGLSLVVHLYGKMFLKKRLWVVGSLFLLWLILAPKEEERIYISPTEKHGYYKPVDFLFFS